MNAQMEEGLQGFAQVQGPHTATKPLAIMSGPLPPSHSPEKRRRGGSAGGMGDHSFPAPEQAHDDEESAANRPRMQQQGSDDEQER